MALVFSAIGLFERGEKKEEAKLEKKEKNQSLNGRNRLVWIDDFKDNGPKKR